MQSLRIHPHNITYINEVCFNNVQNSGIKEHSLQYTANEKLKV